MMYLASLRHTTYYIPMCMFCSTLSLSLARSLQLCCLPKDLASLSDAHWHHHHLRFNSQSAVILQDLNMDEI